MKKYIRNTEEEKQMGQKTAGRFSKDKIRHDLVAPWALNEIARVYTYGTQKYDDDNWWKGLKWKRDVFGCILRHIWKWFRGEVNDDESGLHHLAHAAWNCITLMEYERCGIGTDDRVPLVLDLMDRKEKRRRLNMWVKLADMGKDKEYNGLDTKNTFKNKLLKINDEVRNNENEISDTNRS
jgi:hypothetical protein